MKKLIIGTALAALLASPALAQSYSPAYGTGNTINLPLAEHSDGIAGVGVRAYNGAGSSAFIYSPRAAVYAFAPAPGYFGATWHSETE